MAIKVQECQDPVTKLQLDALERLLEVRIPASYRSWLLKHNGGRPEPARFKFKLESGPYSDSSVAWFFAVYDGVVESLEAEVTRYKIWHRRLPESLIPVARDPFGNLLCIPNAGQDEGKVYFWDHEEETDPPSYANCHLLADSFDEFIQRLY